MNPNLPPQESAEWHELRVALYEAHQLVLGDFRILFVDLLLNDDMPAQYHALADFRDRVIAPAAQYDFTVAVNGLRAFMREYPVLRIRFQEAFDGIFLPALRMFAQYQEYYNFYGPP